MHLLRNKTKQSAFDALLENNDFETPKAMIESEVDNMIVTSFSNQMKF